MRTSSICRRTTRAGEVIGILGSENPSDVLSAMQSTVCFLESGIGFRAANDAGDIVLISADPVAVNDLARSIALLAQTKILQSGEQGFDVPWGTLSGITFLSGKGGGVHFRAIPVGSASTHFASTFRSMGINQTLHRIFLNIDAQLSVVIPGVDVTVNTETEVLLAESVIVGKVPDTYLQSDKLDEMLNLVP